MQLNPSGLNTTVSLQGFGKVGCFSAHPLKNLNGIGDCGFLTTNDVIFVSKKCEIMVFKIGIL